MRIAFFGTPVFAVPSLRALVGESFDVCVVVTQPDRPRGRSRTTRLPSPVKVVALEEDLPVMQPLRPVTAEFYDAFRQFRPDLGVVVAYGHILKPELLAIPPQGMINVHASLLPKLRGASPIRAAILASMETTGITIMQVTEGLDSGPILHQVPTSIEPDETGGELAERLSELGALALVEYLALWSENATQPRPQNDAEATVAPKTTRADCRIRWQDDALAISRAVRAYDPTPGAWTTRDGQVVKCFSSTHGPETGIPGEILAAEPTLVIATGLGALHVREVQPEGRGRMSAAAWARGRGVKPGQHFE